MHTDWIATRVNVMEGEIEAEIHDKFSYNCNVWV
jgi:hypothetical protein